MEVLEGLLVTASLAAAVPTAQRFLAAIPILSVTTAIAERGAELRWSLRSQSRRVDSRALDLVIAATALNHGLTLITRNVRDYRDIPGLSLYAGT